MKILVIGSGGREHALAWKIAQSPRVDKVVVAPGNGGICRRFDCADVGTDDREGLVSLAAGGLAAGGGFDLVVVGPEGPLVQGLADALAEKGIRVFGPSRGAAEIEGSKRFAKEFMARHGIPTAAFDAAASPEAARKIVRRLGLPIVVKADGLAAGKGVVVAGTLAEADAAIEAMMVEKVFGKAADCLVIEECLRGREASFMAVSDGSSILPLETAQDHKRVGDGDTGPNTGGMGAFSPAPGIGRALFEEVQETVLRKAVAGLRKEGRPFRGVLYAGLMLTADGPKVLEFNARFGDPETQPVLMRLESDLVDLMEAAVDGTLARAEAVWKRDPAVCVVAAAKGYPARPETGQTIEGLDEAARWPQTVVFHAGTRLAEGGRIVTNGGRVLGVTSLGKDLAEARQRAYGAMDKIRYDGMHYRRDIGLLSQGEAK
ncbi:MAG: phosphoribosylamine--glycine ligase [Nitrospirae bacterium]|nr:phosphoribosylamine--glycine ligase [Nitrospirota bacterium]